MSFDGLKVLSLESRRANEMETLIRKQGGDAFVAPSVRERALEDHGDAFLLLEQLERSEIEILILMTGVGLTFWHDVLCTKYDTERVIAALKKTKLLVRGPKPVAVLRPWGLNPYITIPEPNSWKEVVGVIAARAERRVGMQEYGRPNVRFVEELEAIGAEVRTYALYRWDLPEDLEPLREAARRLARRACDVAIFTSSIQLEHLLQIAGEEGVGEEVRAALKSDVAVASVGPVMSATLVENGFRPDVVPQSPKMGALVRAAAEESHEVLRRKRAGRLG